MKFYGKRGILTCFVLACFLFSNINSVFADNLTLNPEGGDVIIPGDLNVLGTATFADFVFSGANLGSLSVGGVGLVTGISEDFQITSVTGNAGLAISSADSPHWAIYQEDADDSLRFWNLNDRVVFTKTGNVGIGTVTPSDGLLHLYKNSTLGSFSSPTLTSSVFRIQDSTASMYFDGNTIFSSSDFYIGPYTDSALIFGTNNSEKMRVTSGGNVGIGTSSPYNLVDIGAIESNMDGNLAVKTDSTNVGVAIQEFSGGEYYGLGVDSTGSLRFTNSGGANDVMILDDLGNVGIGTTSPLNTLHVAKDSHLNAIFDRTDSDGALTLLVGTAYSGLVYSGTGDFVIGNNTYGNKNNSGAENINFFIKRSTGNVGIGTVSPQVKTVVTSGSSEPGDQTGTFYITDGTGINTDHKLQFGIKSNDYAWIQSVKPGTAVRNLILNPRGGNIGIGTVSPSKSLDIAGSGINLDNTTTSSTGIIWKNGNRFIHNFQHPTGSTAVPDGYNTFIGINAGNFTMGSTATQTYHGSYNTGIGNYSLQSNTTGNSNTGLGRFSLFSNTTGSENTGLGMQSLQSNTTGNSNTSIGYRSLYSNTTSNNNIGIGNYSLYSNITGTNNIGIGYGAGRYIADESTANQTSTNSVYLGYNTKALASGDTNEIVIGYETTGVGSNSVVLGNDDITKTVLKGNVGIGTDSPSAKLHVYNSTSGGAIFQIGTGDGDSDATIDFGYNGYGWKWLYKGSLSGDNNELQLWSEGAGGADQQAYGIKQSGIITFNKNAYFLSNVGIGTSSPSHKLEVAGNVNISNNQWLSSKNVAGTGDINLIRANTSDEIEIGNTLNVEGDLRVSGEFFMKELVANDFAVGSGFDTAIAEGLQISTPTGDDNNAGLSISSKGTSEYWAMYQDYDTKDLRFWRGDNRVTFTDDGKVGIGTTSPDSLLHINSSTNAIFTLQSTQAANSELNITANANNIDYKTIGINDVMSFSTYYGEKMRITPEGNVGIGTTNPTEVLQIGTKFFVQTDGDTSIGRISIGSAALSVGPVDSVNKVALYVQAKDASNVDIAQFGINGTNKVVFDKSGNVGIGTTSPNKTLDVNGSIGIKNTAGIHFKNSANNFAGSTTIFADADNNLLFRDVGGSNNALVIKSGGNVGIGTTTPSQKLTVANTLSVTNIAGAQKILIGNQDSAGTNNPFIINSANGSISFGTGTSWEGDGGTFTSKMRIDASGNVGIGTTTPAGRLHVYDDAVNATSTFTVNKNNASATGNIADFQFNGSSKVRITKDGYIYGSYLANGTAFDNAYTLLGTTGTTISRNIADANTTLTVNQANASSTGYIQNWAFAGASKAFMTNAGYLYGSGISNFTNPDNSIIYVQNTGTYIRRNIADANPVVRINQVNTSSTGDILQLEHNSIDRFNVAYDGTTTLSNDKWLRAKDFAGTGVVNMIKVNTSNEIEIGTNVTISGNLIVDTLTAQNLQFAESSVDSLSIGGKFESTIAEGMQVMTPSTSSNNAGISISSKESPHWAIYQDDATDDLRFWNVANRVTITNEGNVGIGTTTPSKKLDISGDGINLEKTTTDSTGIIWKNGSRFIHNFSHPTGDTAVPSGYNTFVGENAGNFTMGSTATHINHGSYNTVIGYGSLSSNTTGYANTVIGVESLRSNTTGLYNTGIGYASLYSNTTGSYNTVIGNGSLFSNTTGYRNTGIGNYSLNNNTTGYRNTGIGYEAGRYIAGGTSPNQTSTNSTYLGYNTKALADGDTNEIVIGYETTGVGSNSVVLGNDNIIKTVLKGNIGIGVTSPQARLTIPKNEWIASSNVDGTSTVNMFRVNSNGEIQVGAPLIAGTLTASEDTGATTLFNMPVSSSSTAGTEMSASIAIDYTPILKVYSESDGMGGIQNEAVNIIGDTNITGDLTVDGNINLNKLAVDTFAVGSETIDSNISEGLQVLTTTGNAGISIKSVASPHWAVYQDDTTDDLRFWNTANRVTITNEGNVGMGTTGPLGNLHIVETSLGSTPANDADELIIDAAGASGMTILSSTTGNIRFGDAADSSRGAIVYNHSDDRLTLADATGSVLNLVGGNVGIGTTTPAGSLHVYNNIADATTTLTVNKNNASATGNLVDFQFNGSSISRLDKTGNFYIPTVSGQTIWTNNIYNNVMGAAASTVSLSTTGTNITRNIADTNVALTVNQNHASSTGAIQTWQFNGTNKAWMNTNGYLYTNGIANPTSSGNSTVYLNSNGTHITRNVADTNPVIRVNQLHSGSTGDLLQLESQSVDKFTVAYDGTTTLSNDKWLRAKNASGTDIVNMFKVNTSGEIEVGAPFNIGTIYMPENSGAITLANMPVTGISTIGTENSYSLSIDSNPILKVYSESDGMGGIQNEAVNITGDTYISGDLQVDGTFIDNSYIKNGEGYRSILTEFKYQLPGQVTLTNGSPLITGIGTEFTDDSEWGVSDWWNIWVIDSAGDLYYFDLELWDGGRGYSDTEMYMQGSYQYDLYDSEYFDTFQGVSGTYDYFLDDIGNYTPGNYSVAFGRINLAEGNYSTTSGNHNNAVGDFSTAFGQSNDAIGSGSVAIGYSNLAEGYRSIALGNDTTASGNASIALGYMTKALGSKSSAFGDRSEASGTSSMALGYITKASGMYSTTFGNITEATGQNSTAFGYKSKAAADYSIAGGNESLANNINSIALGYKSKVYGDYSIALGSNTTVFNSYSTAIGNYASASGSHSTSIGTNTSASGDYSTALGNITKAESYNSFVIGRYNIGGGTPTSWVAEDPIFEIGIGSSSISKNNAMTVLKNGNVGIGTTSPAGRLHIYDNVADATSTLTVNKNNASSTGKIADFQFNGTSKAYISKDGYLYTTLMSNISNSNNAILYVDTTGVKARRNVADTNAAFTIDQVHASSTGDLIKAQWQGVDRFNVAYDGTTTISNDKWLRAKDYAGTGYINMFKINESNEIDVGGTLNIGNLSLAEDSGAVTLVNLPVSSYPSIGTEQSYSFSIDSDVIAKIYAEADGSGGIQNPSFNIDGDAHITGDLQVDGTFNLDISSGSTETFVVGSETIDTNISEGLQILTNTGNAGLAIKSTTSPHWAVYQDDTTDDLRFWNTANRLTLTDAGNVGVGVTDPSTALEVNGDITADHLYLGNTLFQDHQITFSNTFDGFIKVDGSENGSDGLGINLSAGSSGVGTDLDGGDVTIGSGGSTGSGTSSIIFKTPEIGGASGAATRVNATRFVIDGDGITTTGNFELGNTTYASQNGIIYKNSTPFLHNFNYGDNGSYTTSGGNIFIGENAGNFTMGSTATFEGHSSYNTGIGYYALNANTIGFDNTAVGMYSLKKNTKGYENTAIGRTSLYENTEGYRNSAIGYSSLGANTTGSYNSASGYYSLGRNTSGSNNAAVGYVAGTYIANGASANQTSYNSTYLGANTKALASGDTNEIVIGYNATGVGSNSVVLGNDDITKTVLKGNVGIGIENPGSYKLYVKGTVCFDYNEDGTCDFDGGSSDIRLKENIEVIDNALTQISKIRGIRFDYNLEDFEERHFSPERQIGLIAQEVEKVFPELVTQDKNGYKIVKYDKLVGVLVEAVKELDKKVNENTEKIKNLEEKFNNYEKK